MKYVITGGAGHISKPLTETLLAAGHTVTVIGRNADNLKPLTDKGAKPAIGSVEDVAFITETFKDAHAVYLMIPPNFLPEGGWRFYQNKVADVFIEALKASSITHAVVLSSAGAHMGDGAGPVDGLADF
ncbi:MAG TPA: NAD(P)H-binding protein, partial [Flavisolibacter sp.]|nr:NAD(P)H-binding protein [Flavisolibacter sp.]